MEATQSHHIEIEVCLASLASWRLTHPGPGPGPRLAVALLTRLADDGAVSVVCCLLSALSRPLGIKVAAKKKKKRTRQANRERGRRSRSDVIDGEVRQGCACGPNMPSPSSIA